jgi:hypothetical protein
MQKAVRLSLGERRGFLPVDDVVGNGGDFFDDLRRWNKALKGADAEHGTRKKCGEAASRENKNAPGAFASGAIRGAAFFAR